MRALKMFAAVAAVPLLLAGAARAESNVDQQRDLGFLKTRITVQPYVDLSLVQEAAQRVD